MGTIDAPSNPPNRYVTRPTPRRHVIGAGPRHPTDHRRHPVAGDRLHVGGAVFARPAPAEHEDAPTVADAGRVVHRVRQRARRRATSRSRRRRSRSTRWRTGGIEPTDDGEPARAGTTISRATGAGRVHGTSTASTRVPRTAVDAGVRVEIDVASPPPPPHADAGRRRARGLRPSARRLTSSRPAGRVAPVRGRAGSALAVSSPSHAPPEAGSPTHRAPSTRRKCPCENTATGPPVGDGTRDHPIGPGRDLLGRLTAGCTPGEDGPPRSRGADLARRATFVLAVVPLGEIVGDLGALGQAGDHARVAGAPAWAAEHRARTRRLRAARRVPGPRRDRAR